MVTMPAKTFLIAVILLLHACQSNRNVIQGKVTYINDSSRMEVPALDVKVYLYQSVVQFHDHPAAFDKSVMTGTSGYYSLFPLQDGPYYIYAEKLDTNGKVMYSTGSSANVDGHETKILDLLLR